MTYQPEQDHPTVSAATRPTTLPAVQLDLPARVITARGELDFAAGSLLSDAMTTLIDHNPGDCTLNLSEVIFIDAAAIGCIAAFADRLGRTGASLIIRGATHRVRQVFAVVDLADLLEPGPATRAPSVP